MRVVETVREMREYRRDLTGNVALVATLGGMHAGHEAHLKRAREISDIMVGSLFLNPTQFSEGEDLASYPHDRASDLAMFEEYGTEVVFAPPDSEMYPASDRTEVNPGRIATVLEGAHRPGHFIGVATVVAKLFSIIRPDIATFGEKDAQQLRIIENLNRDLMFGIKIERIETVREPDGLAISSRNRYLTEHERSVAPRLFEALQSGRSLWRSGDRSADAIRALISDLLGQEPILRTDYVSVADPQSMEEVTGDAEKGALLSLAARLGKARLIDNVSLD